MPVLTDTVRERIALILPSLSSDKPGEVAAAAGAIARVLKGAGCDWHDLAKALTERVQVQSGGDFHFSDVMNGMRPMREPARPRGPRPPEGPRPFAARTQAEYRHRKAAIKGQVWAKELKDAIDEIERTVGDLDGLGEPAAQFLLSLRDKCDKYDAVRISAKQDGWIRKLAKDHGVTIPWTEIDAD